MQKTPYPSSLCDLPGSCLIFRSNFAELPGSSLVNASRGSPVGPPQAAPRARRGARAQSGATEAGTQTGPQTAISFPQLGDLGQRAPGRAGHRLFRGMVFYRLRCWRPPRKIPAANRRTAWSISNLSPAAPLGHLGPLIHVPVHRPPWSGSGVPPPPVPAAIAVTDGNGPRAVRGHRAGTGGGARHDAGRDRPAAPRGTEKKQGIRPNRCEHGPGGPRAAWVPAMSPSCLCA